MKANGKREDAGKIGIGGRKGDITKLIEIKKGIRELSF